jgi:hypothetical protein
MARPSGHWLAYLRFDHRGDVRVLHLLCDNKSQLDEVFSLLKALPAGSGIELVQYAVFHSGRNVYLHEAPNFRERHVLTYGEFMAGWKAATGGTEAGPAGRTSRPGASPLELVLDPPALDRA